MNKKKEHLARVPTFKKKLFLPNKTPNGVEQNPFTLPHTPPPPKKKIDNLKILKPLDLAMQEVFVINTPGVNFLKLVHNYCAQCAIV